MEFMKKSWIGSGLQNFHIRTPLLSAQQWRLNYSGNFFNKHG